MEICILTRRPNKAKGHLITTDELQRIVAVPNNCTNVTEYRIMTPEVVERLNKYLATRPDFRRGDVILLEPFFQHSNVHYIFNGTTIQTFDDVLEFPKELQIITEFPIRYWIDFYKGSWQVPFDVSKNLPNLSVSDVRSIQLSDVRLLIISFKIYEETYYISDIPEDIIEDPQEFLNYVLDGRSFYLPERYVWDDGHEYTNIVHEMISTLGTANILFI